MIPNRDYYADRNGKLTEDPEQFAQQVGVRGCFLDERIARRFGITDTLVSVDEPNAPRRVTGSNESSVKIVKAEDKEGKPTESEPKAETPEATATEPKADKATEEKTAKKAGAKKGEKK